MMCKDFKDSLKWCCIPVIAVISIIFIILWIYNYYHSNEYHPILTFFIIFTILYFSYSICKLKIEYEYKEGLDKICADKQSIVEELKKINDKLDKLKSW